MNGRGRGSICRGTSMTEPEINGLAGRALTYFELWRGHRVALSREDLCRRLGCDDRILREAVRELRCRGHLIVADPATGGYRFAEEGQEAYQYIGSLTSRIQALREVVDAMKAQAEREFGPPGEQLRLL